MKRFCLLFVISIVTRNADAQTEIIDTSYTLIDTATTFRLYADEDLNPLQLFPKSTDQNYTMGLGFGFSSVRFKTWFILKPLTKLDNWIIGKDITQGMNTTVLAPFISLNGSAFTPDDLRATDPVRNDRPYAFLLAFSTRRGYVDNERDIVFNTELNIGALGLDIGKWVQIGIHKAMNDNNTKPPFTPEGWHNQVAEGFAPAFLYAMEIGKRLWNVPSQAKNNRSYFDAKVGGGGSIGYYSQLHGAASFRLGLLDSRNWLQDFNPLGSINKNSSTKRNSRQLAELYIFAAARPTFMAYNAMLNGSIWRKSVHTLSWKETNHMILEWTSGISTHIPLNKEKKALDITWVVNAGRTSELNTDLKRTHYWGGIYLGYSW